MTTSSEGIIIRARKAAKIRSRPGNRSREKAKAARTVTKSISAVVITVKMAVFRKYPARGTWEKALA